VEGAKEKTVSRKVLKKKEEEREIDR